jgi:hypothetical protein
VSAEFMCKYLPEWNWKPKKYFRNYPGQIMAFWEWERCSSVGIMEEKTIVYSWKTVVFFEQNVHFGQVGVMEKINPECKLSWKN